MAAPSARHITPLLTFTTPLGGTVASTSSLTGALAVTAAGAGTIASTSSLTGALTVRAALASTLTATSTLTGNLTNAGVSALGGTIAAQGDLVAELTVEVEAVLEGRIDAVSALAGDLLNEEPPAPHVPGVRFAIHWFWERCNHSEHPGPPSLCPECGAKVVEMTDDLEVFCRHYELGATDADGVVVEADCPYIATINEGNYAQPLAADILAGYVLVAPVP